MTGKEKLLKYASDEDFFQKMSPLTSYCNVGPIYAWTNEQLKDYYDKNLKGKKLLCVTASADHALHGVLAKAKQVDCFDINEFCKYYAALKIAMIKTYELDDFLFLMDKIISGNAYYVEMVIESVKRLISIDEFDFWSTYLSCCLTQKNFSSKLFNTIKCLPSNNAYVNERKYLTLKKNLSSSAIFYHDSLVEDLPQRLSNKKYDVIYLSNIISRGCFLDDKKLYEMVLGLNEVLSSNGLIYDYHFNSNPNLKMMFGGYYYALCGTYDIIPWRLNNKENSCVLTYRKK